MRVLRGGGVGNRHGADSGAAAALIHWDEGSRLQIRRTKFFSVEGNGFSDNY